jgi:AP endonuclease 1
VQNAVQNAVHIGANAFALFLKSQRRWDNPPLATEAISGFQELSKMHRIEAHKHCVPHGSYLVNLAAAEPAKADQAYGAFLDDVRRCEQLGIRLYNLHPGNTNGAPRAEALARIAAQLNKAHAATASVVTLLENMAGQGNVVGATWEDLRDIIAQVDDKSRVGVCIDTCHAFAAGHDLRSADAFAATMDAFAEVVGFQYLRALHLNDSKAPLRSHRDLHANIGTGFLGLRAFHHIMNDARFADLPMVLETPVDRKGADGKAFEDKQVWADEIKLLESLVGMDAEGDEFKALEEELYARGEGERIKIQDQVDRKADKDTKKKAPAKGRAKKTTAAKRKKASDSDEDGSESD